MMLLLAVAPAADGIWGLCCQVNGQRMNLIVDVAILLASDLIHLVVVSGLCEEDQLWKRWKSWKTCHS